jgi:hypothetical protein
VIHSSLQVHSIRRRRKSVYGKTNSSVKMGSAHIFVFEVYNI